MKLNPSDKRELGWVALGTLALTAVEIGVFFALGYYTPKALYGAILSAAGGIVEMFLLAVLAVGVILFNPVSTLITIIFPRTVIIVQTAVGKQKAASASFSSVADEPNETETDETDAPDEGGAEGISEPETKGSEKDGTDEN